MSLHHLKRLAFAGVVLFSVQVPLQAQPTELQGDALFRAILQEMRLLRSTMQKTAAQDLRAKVLLERSRMQNEIVRELQREFDQREEREGRSMEEPFDVMYEEVQDRLTKETDPQRRQNLERQASTMKRRQESQKKQREQSILRMQRLEARLAEEKSRQREIEEELGRLQREIAAMKD